MKLTEITNYNLQSERILNESWSILTERQRLHVGAWERNVWPLMEQLNKLLEAELTADQIQQIFANAEKISIEGGKNLTALGKGAKVTAEVSGKVKAEIDKLIKQAADSEPVKNMDQQFDKLRSELANKVKTIKGGDKILAGVDKWKQFATENPGKSAFIIGAMTSLLAFASGGIMSGAAIGFFLRLANNTIQGDKLSTAVGKATKTAAIGAVAGAIGDMVSANVEIAEPASEGAPSEVSLEAGTEEMASATNQAPEEVASSLAELTEEQYRLQVAQQIAERYGDMSDEMIQKIADNVTISGDYPENFKANFDGTVVRNSIYLTPEEAEAYRQWSEGKDVGQLLGPEGNEWLKQNVEGADEQISAREAEAAARAAEIEKDNILPKDEVDAMSDKEIDTRIKELKANPDLEGNEELQRELRQLQREVGNRKFDFGYDYGNREPILDNIEESLWKEFELYQQSLNEGPLGAAAKNFAKSVGGVAAAGARAAGRGIAGAVKRGASAVGKELGQQITARKLNKLWKDAGSPTDTGSVANILAQAGMDDEQIGLVGQENNIELKKTAPATDQQPQAGDQVPTDAKAATPAAGTIDIKSLAAEIKKAGIADAVKQMLAKPAA